MGKIFVSNKIKEEFCSSYQNPDNLKAFCKDKYFYIDEQDDICLKASSRRERSDNEKHFAQFKHVSEQTLEIVKKNATELE